MLSSPGVGGGKPHSQHGGERGHVFVTEFDNLHCKIDAFSEYFSTKQLSSCSEKLLLRSLLTASRPVAMLVTGMWEGEFWGKHPD